MKPPTPPGVSDIEEHWTSAPPTPSTRCLWWQAKLANGWRPNRRIRALAYHAAARWFGVWIWEYNNVLRPILEKAREERGTG